MFWFLTVFTILLLFCLLVGLTRLLIGPTESDRMLVAQLFGNLGVTILIILHFVSDFVSLLDVALVITLLACITTIAFVKLAENNTHDS